MADELLAAAAAALGAPEELVLRSAQARAEAEGNSVDEILAAWAGGQAAPVAESPPPSEPEELPGEPAPEPEPEPVAPVAAPTPVTPAPVMAAPEPPPPVEVPDAVTVVEAQDFEVVTTVATSALKERTKAGLPVWLSSVFIVVPLVAIFLLITGGAPECGRAGALDVDPIGGQVVNCDGSEFAGRGGADGVTTDYLAIGQELY